MMEIIIFNSHDPKNHVSFYQHFVSICHNIIIIHELLHFFFFLTPRMLIFIKLLCLAFIFSFLMKFPTLCFSNRFSPVIIFDKKKKKTSVCPSVVNFHIEDVATFQSNFKIQDRGHCLSVLTGTFLTSLLLMD